MNMKERLSLYGIAHGLANAGAIVATWFTTYSFYAVAFVAIAGAVYWYQREAKARGAVWLANWKYPNGEVYWDSIFDAITPAIVSAVSIVYLYSYLGT